MDELDELFDVRLLPSAAARRAITDECGRRLNATPVACAVCDRFAKSLDSDSAVSCARSDLSEAALSLLSTTNDDGVLRWPPEVIRSYEVRSVCIVRACAAYASVVDVLS